MEGAYNSTAPLNLTSQVTSLTLSLGMKREASLASWQVQDAKARFSEFLDATLEQGPQVVTRRGVRAAVLVPIEQWDRLQSAARPSLKALLLAPEGRFENLTSAIRTFRRRAALKF